MHEPPLADIEAAWDAEIERRIAAHERGEAARAAAFPQHGKLAPRNSRRRRVTDFKFSLVYTETDYGVLIHAVAPDHRMPEYRLSRLADGNK